MTEKDIQKIIEMVLITQQKEALKRQQGYCYQNTVLLLKNYRKLKDHVEYAISHPGDVKSIEEKIEDMQFEFYADYDEDLLQQKPDLFIDSIMSNRVRTALMVAHTDAMVIRLRKMCMESGAKEYSKFIMFYDVYFKGLSNEDVAVKMSCSPSQASRNVASMVDQLSVLLWGCNALSWLV